LATQILAEDKKTLIADMNEEGREFLIAKGGNGGFGNA
jgi:GTP-binding protein